MQSQHLESPLMAFIRKCYEIGNTPILGSKKKKDSNAAKAASISDKLYAHSKTSRDSLSRFMDQGTVKVGAQAQFSLNGEDFHVDENTWIVGAIAPGDEIRIVGVIKSGIGRYATKVSIVRKVSQ